MILNSLGYTGLKVSALGFGAMHINDERTTEAEAGALLNHVLDLGLNLVDTARGYGLSEERIGRHIAHRRAEFVLSTKVGYGVEGVPDWTYDCIVQGVERALKLMKTDWLDIVHLHSCPLHLLQQGDVTRALNDCRQAGKLRVAAYSGDNAEIDFAIDSGAFGSLQTSISLCDQAHLKTRAARADHAGIGVIAKRPLAGAVWRHAERPGDFAEGQYWDRFKAMGLPTAEDWADVALRFAAFHTGAASAIVGTARPANLRRNLDAIARGPLPADLVVSIRAAFDRQGDAWPGLI
ncbi:aryl-alcohol dehydrogenase-like predicted oxidoreductase [Pelomonas saccharophila]|jgi:aryl-alcohol dehydrogenase-like predicted oxidoreductase|uniref:Aryl-alcohol dehydrogenase-like predicted oxidoreductase n=1 Tax=Roseateles saccharophilus TaxID=304 RepID=A0ABU1YFQ3_ROSSA|nr:aldo/keto reductase [Roseateles saccharophilus]MDR7267682.1 aryl-alcohol dehydrogenase-like predicted oxidoreductase [Roseateles saccharophilus]